MPTRPKSFSPDNPNRSGASLMGPALPLVGGGATILAILAGAPLGVSVLLCVATSLASAALLYRRAKEAHAPDTGSKAPATVATGAPPFEREMHPLDERTLHRERNAAVDRLIGIVAEDIDRQRKTIVGSLQSLESHLGGQPVLAQKLSQIRMALDRTAAFKARLLAFSDQAIWLPEQIDVSAMLAVAAGLSHDALLSEATQLKLDEAENLWPVEADPDQMLTALLHLVVNARDSMLRGGTITVTARNVSLKDMPFGLHGDHVAIAVADMGTGIATEHLGQIFMPFFSTKAPHYGAGLGLSQVKTTALRAGGDVTVSSTPGTGTTVTLYLPRTAGELQSAESEAEAPALDILIATGDEAEAASLAARARAAGYSVQTTASALDACAIVHKLHPHLVITDTAMRGIIDNISLGRYLRHRHPELRIALTGIAPKAAEAGDVFMLPDNPSDEVLATLVGRPAAGECQKSAPRERVAASAK